MAIIAARSHETRTLRQTRRVPPRNFSGWTNAYTHVTRSNSGVEAQPTLGGRHFRPKFMYEQEIL